MGGLGAQRARLLPVNACALPPSRAGRPSRARAATWVSDSPPPLLPCPPPPCSEEEPGERPTDLFFPSYSLALAPDPLLAAAQPQPQPQPDIFLSVGLDSGITDFRRPRLNLLVLLDVSGSMVGGFQTPSGWAGAVAGVWVRSRSVWAWAG